MSKNPASLIGAGLGLGATLLTGKAGFLVGLAGKLVSKITGFGSSSSNQDPLEKEIDRNEVSPTYSHSSSNMVRIGQVVPMIYGDKVRVKPDIFIQSFLDIEQTTSTELVYHQIFCIGVGDYLVNEILLNGKTNLIGRDGFDYQVVYDTTVTLFSDPFRFNSSVIAGTDLPYQSSSGDNNWLGWEVVDNTLFDTIYLDLILFFKNGYYSNNATVDFNIKIELAKVNDDGSYAHITERNLSVTMYQTDPFYRKFNIPIPSEFVQRSRVAVRLCRPAQEFTGDSQDEIFVTSLTAVVHQPNRSEVSFEGGTLVAMKSVIKAGETIEHFNNIDMNVSRKTRRRDDVFGWLGVGVTDNPIDHLLDLLTDTTYGEGLTDSELDLVTFDRQKVNATTRGDTCNIVFDTSITIKDAMASICKTIRSTITINDGVATMVRDEAVDNPKMMFTGDIFKDSLSISIRTPKQSDYDAVSIRYMDNRTQSESMVTESGSVSDPRKSKVITISGISTESHAMREAVHYYNDHHKRFATVTFSVDMEAILLNIGDKIAMSHYLLCSSAQHGVLDSIDPATRVFRSSIPFKREDLSVYRVCLRGLDGSIAFDGQVTFLDDYRLMIDDVTSIIPSTYESEQAYTLYRNPSGFDTGFIVQIPLNASHRPMIMSIYNQNDSLVTAKVSSLKMKNEHSVEIQAVIDDDMVYS